MQWEVKTMPKYDACWHSCPQCKKDWSHLVHGNEPLDEYFLKCASCAAVAAEIRISKEIPSGLAQVSTTEGWEEPVPEDEEQELPEGSPETLRSNGPIWTEPLGETCIPREISRAAGEIRSEL